MFVAYLRTFHRMGLKAIPMKADTGPIGGDLSHEFIILAETGESQVFCHRDLVEKAVPGADTDYDSDLSPIIAEWTQQYAATEEMHDAARFEAEVPEARRLSARGIEVGHIFYFGTKYSEPMKCHGAGPGRQPGADRGRAPMASASRGWWARSSRRAMMMPGSSGRYPSRRSRSGSSTSRPGDAKTDAACAEIYARLDGGRRRRAL